MAYAMTFGHYFARDTLNRDHFVEFSYWGLNRFQDEAAITAISGCHSSGVNTISSATSTARTRFLSSTT